MKGGFRVFMHPHASGPVLDFRNIAGIDLVIGQGCDKLQAFPFCFRNFAVFDLLNLSWLPFSFFDSLSSYKLLSAGVALRAEMMLLMRRGPLLTDQQTAPYTATCVQPSFPF